jgi:hypothetical protein
MTALSLTNVWESEITQIETTEPVQGGPTGVDNRAPRQLGNRTVFIESRLRALCNVGQTATFNEVALKCTNVITMGAGWSRTGPIWLFEGSNTATSIIEFDVPTVSGELVQAQVTAFFYQTVASPPNMLAMVGFQRWKLKTTTPWYETAEAEYGGFDSWEGAYTGIRTVICSGNPLLITGTDRHCTVRVHSAYSSMGYAHKMAILPPLVLVK